MRRINWHNPRQQVFLVIGGAMLLYIYYAIQQGFTFQDLLISVYGLVLFRFDVIPESIKAFFVDVVIVMGFGSIAWLTFFAQFVLPVRTIDDRLKVVDRLLNTLTVGQGPAIFIRNGEIVETPGESQRSGAGVILLDSASAAVLHNHAGFTKAVGPGLEFTERGERIADTVDLHLQVRKIGPVDTDKDPEEHPEATEDDLKVWDERRLQTRALTRDGVEVVPNIIAAFRLISEPGGNRTQFGFNADSVWRAVAYQAIYPDAPIDTNSRQVAWDWLPVQIAADLWREYLRKYTLNDLFEFSEHPIEAIDRLGAEVQPTVFEHIVAEINNRMKKSLFIEFDDFGKPRIDPTTKKHIQKTSRENWILRERGLSIVGITINNLRFKSDPIEKRLLEQWKNSWLERAKEQQRHTDELTRLTQLQGEMDAQRDFSARVSRPLYRRLLRYRENNIPAPTLNETLELLMQGSLDLIRQDAEHAKNLVDLDEDLIEIQDWLKVYRNGQ